MAATEVWNGDYLKQQLEDLSFATLHPKQYAEIDHGKSDTDTLDPTDSLIALDSGLVTLSATATIEDGDGDQDDTTVSIDLGGKIVFEDDTPSISAVEASDDTIVLTTQDAETIDTNSAVVSDTDTADFNDALLPLGGSLWVRLVEKWFAQAR